MFLWSLSVKKKDLAMEHHVFHMDCVDFHFTMYIYCCYNSVVVEHAALSKKLGIFSFYSIDLQKRKKSFIRHELSFYYIFFFIHLTCTYRGMHKTFSLFTALSAFKPTKNILSKYFIWWVRASKYFITYLYTTIMN